MRAGSFGDHFRRDSDSQGMVTTTPALDPLAVPGLVQSVQISTQ